MGKFSDLEHHFRCFREEIGAMLDFNFFSCWREAPVSKVRQLTDMLILYSRHGFLPESYYNYRFYQRKIPLCQCINGFVSDKDRYRRLGTVNNDYRDVLRNKWLFHKIYSLHAIPVPQYYGNYHGKRGTWNDGSSLCGAKDIEAGIRRERYDSMVAKPVVGSGGNRVYIFPRVQLGRDVDFFDGSGRHWTAQTLADQIGDRDYIFEARVEQHPDLSAVYPGSLNTVRIITLSDGQKVIPWAAVLRAGTRFSGSVDNWGQGGISISVDVESGKMGRGVVSVKYLKKLSQYTDSHPDTQYEFAGKFLPHWETVLATVERAAKVIPGLPYVAWDVAITEANCAIIEGNHRPDVNLLQVHGGLLRDENHSRWWQDQLGVRKH